MVKKEKESPMYKPKVNDRVICESRGVRYEAKVLNIGKDPKDNEKNAETKYYVHYIGWSKHWDEYASIDRIQEMTDSNVKLMKEEAKKESKNQAKGPGFGRKRLSTQPSQSNSSLSPPSSQETASESIVIEPEEPIQTDRDIKIKIPDELKSWLIDDDNNIKNKKLFILPAKPSVAQILKDFINYKKTTSRTANEAIITEFTLGVKDYFNVMLGSHLLYKFERLQYQNLLKEHGKDVDLAAHYGVIHIVRLFTKIGKELANSSLEPQHIQSIVVYMQELLRFIFKQSNIFDLEKNYYVAPPEYIKNALK